MAFVEIAFVVIHLTIINFFSYWPVDELYSLVKKDMPQPKL